MTTQQTPSVDEDGAMRMKGPEKASKWTLCLDYFSNFFFV